MFPWSDPSEALRFDHFMNAVLHHPEFGYYARRIRGIGQRGDFTTTAVLSPALGRAVAHWAATAMRKTACRNLIELGPGAGTLAAAVLHHLPWRLRHRCRLHLVETSGPLRAKQSQLLTKHVSWHASAADALRACGGNACLYSNEFADAFAVRRLRQIDGHWQELHLLPGHEVWLSSSDLPQSIHITHPWPNGQIIEVHESYQSWLAETLPLWKSGRFLTIDYGARCRDLYHRQPRGSLRAYFHQQALTGPDVYAHPGFQDLTADVNFSDLIQWSSPWVGSHSLITQREFLLPYIDTADPADLYAIDPDGPGTAFLCLDQECR